MDSNWRSLPPEQPQCPRAAANDALPASMADASVLFNAVLIESDEDPPELGAVLVPGRAQVSTPCSMIAQRSRALADPRCRPRRPTPPAEATFPPLEVLVARPRHQATELIITNTEIEMQSTYKEKEQLYKELLKCTTPEAWRTHVTAKWDAFVEKWQGHDLTRLFKGENRTENVNNLKSFMKELDETFMAFGSVTTTYDKALTDDKILGLADQILRFADPQSTAKLPKKNGPLLGRVRVLLPVEEQPQILSFGATTCCTPTIRGLRTRMGGGGRRSPSSSRCFRSGVSARSSFANTTSHRH